MDSKFGPWKTLRGRLSAGWQGARDSIEGTQVLFEADTSDTIEHDSLMYDFYGFPSHYYKQKYHNRGSKKIAGKVMDLLQKDGDQGLRNRLKLRSRNMGPVQSRSHPRKMLLKSRFSGARYLEERGSNGW